MIFDLFHSISDPVVGEKQIGPKKVLDQFFSQSALAESLGVDTIWVAESHFSSETQKKTSVATIQNFYGEVGLNCDSFQLFHLLEKRTKRVNFGTGIHNIVGGSGGPIASSERANLLKWVNQEFWGGHRIMKLGIASGRFPYQNTPFGIVPRNQLEETFWPIIKRLVFVEATEIFLRLLKGENLSSSDIQPLFIEKNEVEKVFKEKAASLFHQYQFPLQVQPRWNFEVMQLVPQTPTKNFEVVLGSSDPHALKVANALWDVDLFNLSFTPPEQIEKLHLNMAELKANWGGGWKRSRLPRTVMVFIDKDSKKAHSLANFVIDTYIEAMKGTAMVPDKHVLLSRALVGDAAEIRDQLHPSNPRGFHAEDRLMLWFEFNQLDGLEIENRMRYFFNEVVEKL